MSVVTVSKHQPPRTKSASRRVRLAAWSQLIALTLAVEGVHAKEAVTPRKTQTATHKFGPGKLSKGQLTKTALQKRTPPPPDRDDSWQPEWLPLRAGRLYRTMLADPFQINFSVGLRLGDRVVATNMVDASFGGAFPLVRLKSSSGIAVSLATEAGVWFIPWTLPVEDGSRAQEFFSSDFYLGVPLSLLYKQWAARGRLYHISYHLGDEASVEHLSNVRRSKTLNAMDLFGSYRFAFGLRTYAGLGGVARSTGYAPGGPVYFAGGAEAEFAKHSIATFSTDGALYVACFLQSWPLADESLSGTYAFGYISKPYAAEGRSLRAYVEANHGRSWVGRFSDPEVQTLGFRLAFDH